MSALKERFIKECIKEDGEELKVYDPINLARLIAVFAHEGQFRVNNEPYWIHPGNMHQHFKAMFSTNEYPSICYNIMGGLGFPTKGVEAVIWLHDVVEDTETTQKDIREIFEMFGYLDYFDNYIDEPLKLITHNKKESYEEYVKKVLTSPTASLVKMFDLMDNLYLFSLEKFSDYEYKRAIKYIKCFKMINDKYHFIEKMKEYDHELNSPYKYEDWL